MSSSPTAPAWRPDPAGKHLYRYHDGHDWTEHVSDGRVSAIDPLSPSLPGLSLRMAPGLAAGAATRRADADATARTVGRIALLLGGAYAIALGLSSASCHVRERQAAGERSRHVARLASGVKTVSTDVLDPADVGKVVHLTGMARAQDPLTDDELGLTVLALALERSVSKYQWIETCEEFASEPSADGPDEHVERERRGRRSSTSRRWKKCGYVKGWRDTAQAMHGDRASRYPNPAFPLKEGTTDIRTRRWAVGAFGVTWAPLPESTTRPLQPLAASATDLRRLHAPLRARAWIDNGAIRIGERGAPKVGDLAVRFRVLYEMPVSVVGERDFWGITSRSLPDGSSFIVVREGTHTAAEMIASQPTGRDHWANHVLPAGFVTVGMLLLFWPLRFWGRRVPGPALLTGAGPFLFVPLAAVGAYAGVLARAWWAVDRHAALLAMVVAAGSLALLLLASATLQLLLRPEDAFVSPVTETRRRLG